MRTISRSIGYDSAIVSELIILSRMRSQWEIIFPSGLKSYAEISLRGENLDIKLISEAWDLSDSTINPIADVWSLVWRE